MKHSRTFLTGRRRKGFSLIEAMIAAVILAGTVYSGIGIFNSLIKARTFGHEVDEAVRWHIRHVSLYQTAGIYSAREPSDFDSQITFPGGSSITVSDILTTEDRLPDTYRLESIVRWNAPGEQRNGQVLSEIVAYQTRQ